MCDYYELCFIQFEKKFKHSGSELWSFLPAENGYNCTWTIKKSVSPHNSMFKKTGEMILNPEIICEYFPYNWI